jgi:hypothetical protein
MTAWPWPPIQVSDCEWIIMRHERTRPKAIVRRFDGTSEHPAYFRAVTWAPRSTDRTLIGRYRSLELADAAVLVDSPTAISDGPDKDRLRPRTR